MSPNSVLGYDRSAWSLATLIEKNKLLNQYTVQSGLTCFWCHAFRIFLFLVRQVLFGFRVFQYQSSFFQYKNALLSFKFRSETIPLKAVYNIKSLSRHSDIVANIFYFLFHKSPFSYCASLLSIYKPIISRKIKHFYYLDFFNFCTKIYLM